MSSLGEKIKHALGGGSEHSKDAERGYDEHRTPGAFPTDDVAPSSTSHAQGGVDQAHIGGKPVPSSGSHDLGGTTADPGITTSGAHAEHNKLHKKGDPRGQMHQTTDSGVGFEQTDTLGGYTPGDSHNSSRDSNVRANDPSIVRGTGSVSAAPTGGLSHDTIGEDHPGQKTRNPADSATGNQSKDTHHGRDAALSAGAVGAGGFAEREAHNRVHNGKDRSTVDNEEPYWGNLPQGAGTYNTVTGHGSGEDTSGQHRTVPRSSESLTSPTTGNVSSNIPQGSGVYNTVTGHGSNRDEYPHRGNGGTGVGAGYGDDRNDLTHHSADDQRAFPLGSSTSTTEPTNQRLEDNVDRRGTEAALVGTGAAAGVGVGASGSGHHHKDANDKALKQDNTHDPAHDTKSHGGLFHTSHESDPAKHEKSHAKTEEPVQMSNSQGGLFHRQHDESATKQEKHHDSRKTIDPTSSRAINDPTAAPPAYGDRLSDTLQDTPATHNQSSTSHHGRDAGIVGIAGAGAAYEESRLSHSHDRHTVSSSSDNRQGLASGIVPPPAGAGHVPGSTTGVMNSRVDPNISRKEPSSHLVSDAGLAGATGASAGYEASKLGHHHDTTNSTEYSQGSASEHLPQSADYVHGSSLGATGNSPDPNLVHDEASSYRGRDAGVAGVAGVGAGVEGSKLAHHHDTPTSTSVVDSRDTANPGQGYHDGSAPYDKDLYDTGLHDSRVYESLSSDTTGIASAVPRDSTASSSVGQGIEREVTHDHNPVSSQQHPTATNNPGQASNSKHHSDIPSGVTADLASSTSQRGISESQRGKNETNHAASQDPYNKLHSGTPSGVTADMPPGQGAPSQGHHGLHDANRGIGEGSHASKMSTDSKHSGLYNTLSSGTPSGVHIDDGSA
ncbi:hypothetical protein BJ170DRAFT_268211 [Xylariales sp. AK1849]|nr:hypothetical protein BJ170DRAFT_268211 [Xylariales sp. AK1849]